MRGMSLDPGDLSQQTQLDKVAEQPNMTLMVLLRSCTEHEECNVVSKLA